MVCVTHRGGGDAFARHRHPGGSTISLGSLRGIVPAGSLREWVPIHRACLVASWPFGSYATMSQHMGNGWCRALTEPANQSNRRTERDLVASLAVLLVRDDESRRRLVQPSTSLRIDPTPRFQPNIARDSGKPKERDTHDAPTPITTIGRVNASANWSYSKGRCIAEKIPPPPITKALNRFTCVFVEPFREWG